MVCVQIRIFNKATPLKCLELNIDSSLFFLNWVVFYLILRFHQDVGWLSCLRSPTFRHAVESWFEFHRHSTRNFLIVLLKTCLWSFFPDRIRSCCRCLEPMAALRRSSSFFCFVHRRWLDEKFSSLSHSISENFFWIWSLVWSWMMNVFISTIGFVRCGSFSWLQRERRTRSLGSAASLQLGSSVPIIGEVWSGKRWTWYLGNLCMWTQDFFRATNVCSPPFMMNPPVIPIQSPKWWASTFFSRF